MLKEIFKNSRGDTIIEVLLSIAVMSLVLVMSYGLANRDSQYVQQSHEHGEAQKITEEQLELLRSYLTPDTDWTGSHFLCYNDTDPNDDVPAAPTTDPGDCNKGVDGRYVVRISVTAPDTYTVRTTWSSLTTTADQSIDLSYKLPVSSLTPVGLLARCTNGLDDDGDTKIDMADPGCSSPSDNDEYNAPPAACANGVDDDGDSKTDMADPGCSSPSDNDEYNAPPAACADNIDNDGDGVKDMADPGCSSPSDNDEFNPCFKVICI